MKCPYSKIVAVRRRIGADYHTRYQLIPCGRCPSCVEAKKAVHAGRFNLFYNSCDESVKHYWVTLTISPEYYDLETPPLRYLRQFLRYLLKSTGWSPEYYYAAVDIGTQHSRVHLHLIMGISRDLDPHLLLDRWRFGWYRVETLRSPGACRYAMSYAIKTHARYPFKTCRPRLISYSSSVGVYYKSYIRRYKAAYLENRIPRILANDQEYPVSIPVLRSLCSLCELEEKNRLFLETPTTVRVGCYDIEFDAHTAKAYNSSLPENPYRPPIYTPELRNRRIASKRLRRLRHPWILRSISYYSSWPYERRSTAPPVPMATYAKLPSVWTLPGFQRHLCDPESLRKSPIC